MEKPLSLLLIEDNPVDVIVFKAYLKKTVYRTENIQVAVSLAEAVRILDSSAPDIIFSDLSLPDSDGSKTLTLVTSQCPDVPVIVLSANVEKGIVYQTLKHGAQDYLVKGEYDELLLEKTIGFAIERKSILLMAERSRRNYQVLFDLNPMPMIAFDLNTQKIKMVNTSAIRHYGYSREEFTSLTLVDIRPAEEVERFHQFMKNLTFRGTNTAGSNWRHKKKDGTLFDVEISSGKVDIDGQEMMLAVIHDVTEKRKASRLLEESEQRLNLAITSGKMVILDIDYTTGFFRFSGLSNDILGLPARENISSDRVMALVHPQDRQRVASAMEHGKNGQKEIVQFRIVRPDNGREIWMERRSYIVFDENGKAIASRGLLIDITSLKNAQEHLVKSFRELDAAATQQASILNALPAHIALLNSEGTIITVNEAWKKFGEENGLKSKSFCVGESYFSSDDTDPQVATIHEGIRNVIKGSIPEFSLEYACHSPTQKRWFKAIVTPLPTFEKSGAVIMHIDISERKLAEEELIHSQANLISIFDSTDDAYILIDTDLKILAMNRRAGNIDYLKGDVIGQSFVDKLPEERRVPFQQFIVKVQEGHNVQYEIAYHGETGKRWFQIRITPVFSKVEELIGYTICGHEVTNQKRAEKALRESEERFRALIENTGDMFTITDADGTIKYVSPSIEKVLFYRPVEIQSKLFHEKVHPEDAEGYHQLIARVVKHPGELHHLFCRIKDRAQKWVWVEGTIINLIHLPAINGIVSNFRDISERIRIQSELDRNNYILEKANQVARIGYWVADIENKMILSWSPEMYKIFAVDQSTFDHHVDSFFKLVHPDDVAGLREDVRLALAGVKEHNFDHRIVVPDGSIRWIHEQAEVFYDHSGKPVSLIGISTDITDRKTWEDQLRQGKNNLDALINNTNDLIWSIDTNYKIISANKAFRQSVLSYYNVEIHEGDSALTMEESSVEYQQWIGYYTRALKGESLNFEMVVEGIMQELFYFEISLNPIYNDGIVTGVSCFTRDITGKKRGENKLRAANEQYEILSRATNDAVWDWDITEGKIIWNHGLNTLFGYDSNLQETTVEWWRENVHPEDYEKVSQGLSEVFETQGQHWNCDYRFRCVDGNYRHINDRGFAIYEDGLPVRMIGAMQDVHELTEYRMSLEQKVFERTQELHQALEKEKELAELKNRFVSIASHEFRTPLSTIQFAADFLLMHRTKISSADVDAKLENIGAQVNHMLALLDDVLTVGKGDSGKIKVNRTGINIRQFFDELITNVKTATKHSHAIRTVFNLRDEYLNSDEKLLNNIFINLLSNAIKFSPDQKEVLLTCTESGKHLVFEICDNGIGINNSEVESIFEPFNRGTNVGAISGTGLGLTIVKTAVKLLNGDVEISTSKEFKTIFRIRLPRV